MLSDGHLRVSPGTNDRAEPDAIGRARGKRLSEPMTMQNLMLSHLSRGGTL